MDQRRFCPALPIPASPQRRGPRSLRCRTPSSRTASRIGAEGRRGRAKASSISRRNPRLELRRQCPRCARAEASLFRPCGFSQHGANASVRRRASGAPSMVVRPRPGLPRFGRIAQLVEQLTLNQRVQGSSPCAPTKIASNINELARFNESHCAVKKLIKICKANLALKQR